MLDIRKLARAGQLRLGACGSWKWSCGDEPSGEIVVRGAVDHVRLIYKWTPRGRDPHSLDYPVWIERTPCRYGGSRPWFRCPRCQWRRAVIYGVASDGRFGCRRCMRLAYASEAEDACGRSWRTQRKLAARLGAKDDTNLHPPPPKGMHARTYERILRRIWDQEMRRDELLYQYLQRLGFQSERAALPAT